METARSPLLEQDVEGGGGAQVVSAPPLPPARVAAQVDVRLAQLVARGEQAHEQQGGVAAGQPDQYRTPQVWPRPLRLNIS
jgi:hypothetical protein